eukprot:g2910.t1
MSLLGVNTWFKKALFLGYMFLWVSQGMLVYGSKGMRYNPTTVVLLTSMAKLGIALAMYRRDDGSFAHLRAQTTAHRRLWGLYFLPALLYTLYDNLTFVNLRIFDPPTYFILSQLRLVVTGVVYQQLFARRLTRGQWLSLLVLTLGCVVKEAPALSRHFTGAGLARVPRAGWALVGVQILAATFAGVYIETLLKGRRASLNLQNVFMYSNSALCSLLALRVQGGASLAKALAWRELRGALHPLVLLIILNSASMGIVTSLFLKHLSSVLKAIASALEVVLTAVVSHLVFGTDLGAHTVCSIGLVALGIYLYGSAPTPPLRPAHSPKGSCKV